MPARGEVRVRLTSAAAKAVAVWIATHLGPMRARMGDTILTPGESARTMRELTQLAALLAKAARRKRPADAFTVNIPRPLAFRLLMCADVLEARGIDVLAMRQAVRARPGRPGLSDESRSARLDRSVSVDERHRKRLKRQARIAAAHNAWFKEVSARGETLLTATIPLPKI